MRRQLFMLATFVSALLVFTLPALWLRSEFQWEEIRYTTATGSHGILSVGGRLGYHFEFIGSTDLGPHFQSHRVPESYNWSYQGYELRRRRLYALGIEYLNYGDRGEGHLVHFSIPYSYYTALAALCPALWLIGFLRRRNRHIAGLCPKCSYDLRAHKPGDKCPECGTIVAGS